MFPIPALPLPKLHTRVEPYDARTLALVCGFAIAGQAVLPSGSPVSAAVGAAGLTGEAAVAAARAAAAAGVGGGGLFNVASMIGGLLIGGGLIALYFLWPPKLKQGHRVLILGGAGVLGMLWSFTGGLGGFFFTTAFGLMGMAAIGIGLNLWSRNGYSKDAWIFVVSGLGAIAAALLIPIGYGTLPVVFTFSQLGVPWMNIVGRIFYLILALGGIGLFVLLLLNVVLKKEDADPEQVQRFWPVLYFYVPVSLFLVGLFSFFGYFSINLHSIIVDMAYLTLVVWAGTIFMEARQRGESLMAA